MLKGSHRQSGKCREGKHGRQSLLKGKNAKTCKPFHFLEQVKILKENLGKTGK
jgi:hypothetical protein